MALPDHDRGAPREEGPSNVVSIDTHESTPPVRCHRCNRPLTARRSVERRLGPICCRYEALAAFDTVTDIEFAGLDAEAAS